MTNNANPRSGASAPPTDAPQTAEGLLGPLRETLSDHARVGALLLLAATALALALSRCSAHGCPRG